MNKYVFVQICRPFQVCVTKQEKSEIIRSLPMAVVVRIPFPDSVARYHENVWHLLQVRLPQKNKITIPHPSLHELLATYFGGTSKCIDACRIIRSYGASLG